MDEPEDKEVAEASNDTGEAQPQIGEEDVDKDRKCEVLGCTNEPLSGVTTCRTHGGRRKCKIEGCYKFAQAPTRKCKSHGGGYRCLYPNCRKSAASSVYRCLGHADDLAHVESAEPTFVRVCQVDNCQERCKVVTYLCKTHGGGKRCAVKECNKSACGRTNLCVTHGGGRRCLKLNCSKSAVGTTPFCVQHGGGRRCAIDGCARSARSKTEYCQAHRRADELGLSTAPSRTPRKRAPTYTVGPAENFGTTSQPLTSNGEHIVTAENQRMSLSPPHHPPGSGMDILALTTLESASIEKSAEMSPQNMPTGSESSKPVSI